MRDLLEKLEGLSVFEELGDMRELFESFSNKKYDEVITRAISDFMQGAVDDANAAKAKVNDPAMVLLHIAEVVSKCVVSMAFMYQVTKKPAKLKAATARLDKLPRAIRDAARVEGFGPVK
jgi:hypothetical protein